MIQNRSAYLMGLCLTLASLAVAYALEYAFHLEPCSLCVMQRWTLWLAALFCGLAYTQAPQKLGARLYAMVLTLPLISGLSLAARQIWLQHQPFDSTAPCLAGFEQLLNIYPFWQALSMSVLNNHDCGKIDFTVLGLSLADWSFLNFLLLLILNGYLILLAFRRNNETL